MPIALDELDYDHTLHENRSAADAKLYVRFYTDIVPDPVATAESGIRKFRDATMVQIMVPGDKRNIVIREARDDDKQRFAKTYEAFQRNSSQGIDGYPLSQWAMVSRAMVEELKYLGFVTVEQVAGASDAACGKYPGLRELSRRATAWLQAQKDSAPLEQLNSALEARDAQIKEMQAQIAQLIASNGAKVDAKAAK